MVGNNNGQLPDTAGETSLASGKRLAAAKVIIQSVSYGLVGRVDSSWGLATSTQLDLRRGVRAERESLSQFPSLTHQFHVALHALPLGTCPTRMGAVSRGQ